MKGKLILIFMLLLALACSANAGGIHNAEKEDLCLEMRAIKKAELFNTASQNKYDIGIILEKQLLDGACQYSNELGIEIPKNKFSDSDLFATTFLVEQILHKADYSFIGEKDFSEKMNAIFGKVTPFDSIVYMYLNFLDRCDTTFSYYPSNEIEYFGLYMLKGKSFITEFYFIPQLLDYETIYPKIAAIENSMPVKKGDIVIERWKDLSEREDEYNLSLVRNSNRGKVIHRNKYLFNDNKESLNWLLKNDFVFLDYLVRTYGYDKEKLINEDILEKIYQIYADPEYRSFYMLDDLFFSKKCDGGIAVRHGIWETIVEKTTYSDDRYFEMLYNYLEEFNSNKTELTLEEKSQLFCYFGRMEADLIKKYENHWVKTPRVSNLFKSQQLREIAKKNNYFEIDDFEEVLEIINNVSKN